MYSRRIFSLVLMILLWAFSPLVYSQQAGVKPVEIGTIHKISSAVLQEQREYWVYLPEDYNNSIYAPAQYPVVYLLDGDANFHAFTGILQFLSKGPYATIPQMIVVGIANTDRTRDLTPTQASREAYYDKSTALYKNSGGNETFIKFLQSELMPHIDSVYRTSSYKILTGHSFGGLTAANILLNHTDLFNAYIAIDPSMWWDKQILLKQARTVLKTRDFKNRVFFGARANKPVITQDTSTDMQRSNIEFEKILTDAKAKNLRWKYVFYENDDHGTISVPAAVDGLRYIFQGHQIQVKSAVDDPELVTRTYSKLSLQAGCVFQPSESYLDWMGNYALSINKTESALKFYRMNGELYPKSTNVYLSLSKFYENQGDKQHAEEMTRKALTVK